MRRSQVQDQEKRLEREKRDKYQGSARVDLERLDFPCDGLGAIDMANVTWLVSVFERQGCFPDDTRYHIPAIIDHRQLQQAVQSSRISSESLLDQTHRERPELQFPPGFRLRCLHGRHRIQAGKEMAPPQRWWTIDLYLDDLHDDLRLYLAEQISNEKPPSDGVIYCKIREHDLNPLAQARWWVSLRANKQREMERLLRRDDYRAAFDALLDIPGLWEDGFRLGMTKFVFDLKCDEENLHCLEDIRRFWADLFRDDKRAMRKVDHVTVKALEVQAPGASSSDAMSLFQALKRGDVFGAFSLEERMKIWARLCKIDGFVPTLWAFFENFKYIKACAECVKSLVKIPSKMTLFGAMEKSFMANSQRNAKTIVQEAEGVFSFRSGLIQDRIALHYRQLFLYVMRHLRELSPKSTKLERARDKRRKRTAPDKAAWYGLVELAEHLGFRSAQIRKLKSRYLKYAKVPLHSELSRPTLVVDGAEESAERRHACPFDLAYEQSRGFLFLDNMHSVDNSQGSSVTPFFVRRSVYLTFFGRLVSGHSDSDSPTTHPRLGESHAAPTSTTRGLRSDQSQRTHDEDKLIGQEHGSENDPDTNIHSEPQDERSISQMPEEMDYESEERDSGEQEDNPELDSESHYDRDEMDQLHEFHQFTSDPTDPFNSTRPPESSAMEMMPAPAGVLQVSRPQGEFDWQRISRAEAIRFFREHGTSSRSHHIGVLRQMSEFEFGFRYFERADAIALQSLMQDGYCYQVPDVNNAKRVRMANLKEVESESLVLLTFTDSSPYIKRDIEYEAPSEIEEEL